MYQILSESFVLLGLFKVSVSLWTSWMIQAISHSSYMYLYAHFFFIFLFSFLVLELNLGLLYHLNVHLLIPPGINSLPLLQNCARIGYLIDFPNNPIDNLCLLILPNEYVRVLVFLHLANTRCYFPLFSFIKYWFKNSYILVNKWEKVI